MSIGISLGWNCESAGRGVATGIRKKKQDGYNTCPFDMCLTNYEGIIQCLEEDFKYFCDPEYLKIIISPISTGGIVKNERLLYNTRYNFIFNHESQDHANLYLTEAWADGQDHFIKDNFSKFINRYNNRINNFRNYISSGNKIIFLIGNFNDNVKELEITLKNIYPLLDFEIIHYMPSCNKQIFDEVYSLMKYREKPV